MPKKKKEKKKKKKKSKKRSNRISMRAGELAWQKIIDDESGDPYYYNSVTQVIHSLSYFTCRFKILFSHTTLTIAGNNVG